MIHFFIGIQKLFILIFCFGLLACDNQPGPILRSPEEQTSAGDLASTSPPASTPTSDPYAKARKLCVDLTNQMRAKVLGPGFALRDRNAEKGSCSDTEAKITREQRSASNTPVPWHPAWGYCGERHQNSCSGGGYTITALVTACVVQDWFGEGPSGPHYGQLMDPRVKSVSCGFYLDGGHIEIIQSLYFD